jgi:hypothetical protein
VELYLQSPIRLEFKVKIEEFCHYHREVESEKNEKWRNKKKMGERKERRK